MTFWVRHTLVVVGAIALITPSASWIGLAWNNSPQDSPGPMFMGIALAWWAVVAMLSQIRRKGLEVSAWPLFAFWALVGGAGLYLDVNVLVAAAGIGLAWALAWGLCGSSVGLLLVPSLVTGLFALPTTSYMLDEIWLSIGVASPGGLAIKIIISALLLLLGAVGLVLHHLGRSATIGPMANSYAVLGLLAVTGLALAFRPPQFGPAVKLDEDRWAFGDWLGAEIGTNPAEERLFSDSRLSKRAYARPDGRRVAVLIVESEDVHRLHAPEYCLSGSGWKMEYRASSPWSVGEPSATAAELVASRNAKELQGVYWFSSDSRSTTDLTGLRLQSRLVPEEAFTLYMVTSIGEAGEESDQVLSDFLADAPWQSP
jgi:EpsI family protein